MLKEEVLFDVTTTTVKPVCVGLVATTYCVLRKANGKVTFDDEVLKVPHCSLFANDYKVGGVHITVTYNAHSSF